MSMSIYFSHTCPDAIYNLFLRKRLSYVKFSYMQIDAVELPRNILVV